MYGLYPGNRVEIDSQNWGLAHGQRGTVIEVTWGAVYLCMDNGGGYDRHTPKGVRMRGWSVSPGTVKKVETTPFQDGLSSYIKRELYGV